MSRGTLVWLADEPPRPNPQSKAALRPAGAGVRGGVCGFAAAIADAGICARARAAVRGLAVQAGDACAPLDSWSHRSQKRDASAALRTASASAMSCGLPAASFDAIRSGAEMKN